MDYCSGEDGCGGGVAIGDAGGSGSNPSDYSCVYASESAGESDSSGDGYVASGDCWGVEVSSEYDAVVSWVEGCSDGAGEDAYVVDYVGMGAPGEVDPSGSYGLRILNVGNGGLTAGCGLCVLCVGVVVFG